jgi:hypothetical protein
MRIGPLLRRDGEATSPPEGGLAPWARTPVAGPHGLS